MKDPLIEVAEAAAEQFPVRCYFANVTAVDSIAGECTIDIGDGDLLTNVVYLGPAVKVGAQVLYITFRRDAVVLGGTG